MWNSPEALVLASLLAAFATIVRGVEVHFDSAGAGHSTSADQLPIVLPQALPKPDKDGLFWIPIADPKSDPVCLLYVESVSVVVFNVRDKQSAWALLDFETAAGYSGSIKCPEKMGQEFDFELSVKAKKPVSAYYRSDDKKQKEIFQLSAVNNLRLKFNFTQAYYWQLVDASVDSIDLTGAKDYNIPKFGSNSKLVTGVANGDKGWLTSEKHAPSWNINGFKDYGYACARTSPIVWANVDDDKQRNFAVGVTLNNIQLQLNATALATGEGPNKDKYFARFSAKVNDCQPLFSIGTWMGLIVALLLVAVLSFGFLMLNSVQTMDRFDDPKQKQLVINSKEN